MTPVGPDSVRSALAGKSLPRVAYDTRLRAAQRTHMLGPETRIVKRTEDLSPGRPETGNPPPAGSHRQAEYSSRNAPASARILRYTSPPYGRRHRHHHRTPRQIGPDHPRHVRGSGAPL